MKKETKHKPRYKKGETVLYCEIFYKTEKCAFLNGHYNYFLRYACSNSYLGWIREERLTPVTIIYE